MSALLILYGVGVVVTAILLRNLVNREFGGDWGRLEWGRAVLSIVAWPIIAPLVLFGVLGRD